MRRADVFRNLGILAAGFLLSSALILTGCSDASDGGIAPEITREEAINSIDYDVTHPRVYHSPEEVARARRNAEETEWGRRVKEDIVDKAEAHPLFTMDTDKVRALAPVQAPDGKTYFAYTSHKFGSLKSGRICPIDGSHLDWGGFDRPGKTVCQEGHTFPNEQLPDDGDGVMVEDPPEDWAASVLDEPKRFWLVAVYNGEIAKRMEGVLERLAYAYAVTDDERFAKRAALIMDILAEASRTSHEYIVDRPGETDGKLYRPGYQVGRALREYTNAMDLIWNSPALDTPSTTNPQMSKRRNIAENLMVDQADYIWQNMGGYRRVFHNGTVDYIEGIFTVASLLGMDAGYIEWSLEGPVSFEKFLTNGTFRDGQYYEHGYDDTYLGWSELVHHLKHPTYPDGVEVYDDPRLINLNIKGPKRFSLVGRRPQFGDVGYPDLRIIDEPYYGDFERALYFYARTEDPAAKEKYAQLLAQIAQGDPNEEMSNDRWALFNIDGRIKGFDLEKVHQRTRPSELLPGKGHVMMRPEQGRDRGAFIHYGPTLSHGHTDEMALIFYAAGRDMSYDPGHNPSRHFRFSFLRQTVAHNTVVVNETSQVPPQDPGGSVNFFTERDGYTAVELEAPHAYAHEDVHHYRRTTAYVDPSPEQSYLVDIFRVQGHETADYSFHGQGVNFSTNLDLSEPAQGSVASEEYNWANKMRESGEIIGFENESFGFNAPPGNGYGFLGRPRRASAGQTWHAEWHDPREDGARVRLTMLGQPDHEAIVAEGPDALVHNLDMDPDQHNIKYVLARQQGGESAQFVSVIEPVGDEAYPVRRVERMKIHAGDVQRQFAPVAIKVSLREDSRRDYYFSAAEGKRFSAEDGDIFVETDAHFAMIRIGPDGVEQARMERGTTLRIERNGRTIRVKGPSPAYSGRIERIETDDHVRATALEVAGEVPDGDVLAGGHVLIDAPAYTHNSPFAIRDVVQTGSGARIRLQPSYLEMGLGSIEEAEDHEIVSVARFNKLNTRSYYVPTEGDLNANTYFNGRQLVNQRTGATTTVRRAQNYHDRDIRVEDGSIFQPGDDFAVIEIKPGDRFAIPMSVDLTRDGSGFVLSAPEEVSLEVSGQ